MVLRREVTLGGATANPSHVSPHLYKDFAALFHVRAGPILHKNTPYPPGPLPCS